MSQPMPHSMPQTMPSLNEGIEAMAPYETMTMGSAMTHHAPSIKGEPDFTRVQYNQNGVPIAQGHQRHSSMPAYALEYSPAPSFVSSQYEDYSTRGMSFEPITPPQHSMGINAEPAYIANEETGLYSAIPDHVTGGNGMHGMMHLPPSNMGGAHFNRHYGSNVYSVIEGSPTYKQRRRRSSIPTSMSAIATGSNTTTTHAHRPSDLRRSISASVGPVAEGDESAGNSPPGLSYSASGMALGNHHKESMDLSRHGTPLSTVEGSPALNPLRLQRNYSHGEASPDGTQHELRRPGPGVNGAARRARSATVMELGPYPQKSHSCPIPSCGRLFKRLEHLKR